MLISNLKAEENGVKKAAQIAEDLLAQHVPDDKTFVYGFLSWEPMKYWYVRGIESLQLTPRGITEIVAPLFAAHPTFHTLDIRGFEQRIKPEPLLTLIANSKITDVILARTLRNREELEQALSNFQSRKLTVIIEDSLIGRGEGKYAYTLDD